MRLRALFLPAVLGLATIGPAQPDTTKLAAALRAKLEEFRAEAGFPGAVFGYALPDGTHGSVAVGLEESGTERPLRADARMLAGSTGKTFFAAWILTLVSQGVLDLDAPVSTYLAREPWFGKLPNAADLTLRSLMCHQSGIPEHVYDPKFHERLRAEPDKQWTAAELLAFVADKKPLFEAGKGWAYGDVNFIVAAAAAEAASGKVAYQEIERLFLRPLGLSRTGPSDRRKIEGLTMGHTSESDPFVGGAKLLGSDGKLVLNPQFEWAGGGYVSSAEDLARWALALYGGKVLPEPMQKAMRESVPARTGPNEEYGLGVQVRPGPWGRGYGHGGYFPGYLTEMEYVYDAFGVAIQYNTDQNRVLVRNRRKYLLELAAIVQVAREKDKGPAPFGAGPLVRLEPESLRGSLLFGPRGLQQTHPRRRLERLNPVANLQLGVDVRQVEVHRSFRDEELVRRLLAAIAFGDETEHFHLSSGQADRALRNIGSIHHHEPPLVSIPVHPQDSFHTDRHF